jgi:hydroxymethylpyrimidine pyrophosphatase-like HAD family hydrolase
VPIRLVATDIDGTLIGSDGRISIRTRAALAAARDAGWFVVLATGRPSVFLGPILSQVGTSVTHYITGNGTEISLPSSDVITRASMPIEQARDIVIKLREAVAGIGFSIETDTDVRFEAGFAELMPVPLPAERATADVLSIHGDHVYRLNAFHPGLGAHGLLEVLPGLLTAPVVAGHGGFDGVDIYPHHIDKAIGLEKLCAQINVAADEVIAFGDNTNDRTMLQWAGHGVAMANADPGTRAAANEVTASNDDDGIAIVIERLLQLQRR